MDSNFQALPPLKRFILMQQQEQIKTEEESKEPVQFCLPTKKRKQSLYPSAPSTVTTYCLPEKKRVWALQPQLISDQTSLTFDLNVEWKPAFSEETSGKDKSDGIPPVKITHQSPENEDRDKDEVEEECDEDNEEDEDDGIVCAVCQSTDGDQTDPIVFCDGCNLMVHTTCYGNPLVKGIPEGEWFCAQCLAEKPKKAYSSCCLCPNKDGALKPTKDGSWAHVVCAVFVPEVFFDDPEGREGINCSKVPKTRWENKCYICRSKRGCAVECSEPKCTLWFHVTCGLKEDLSIEYIQGKKGAVVAGFCKDHTKLWNKQQQTGKFKIVAREEHK
ncbi:hypothetical protein ACOSQ3_031674 [Xanthoceras sorbifolium]